MFKSVALYWLVMTVKHKDTAFLINKNKISILVARTVAHIHTHIHRKPCVQSTGYRKASSPRLAQAG